MYFLRKLKKFVFLNPLINKPFFFNNLRFMVTGDQKKIKAFVAGNLQKFKCKSVADICCGTADFVQLSGIKYIGIDINKSFIDYARGKYEGKNVSFIIGDALNLPFSGKSFDAVLIVSALHHFSDPQARKLLAAAKRVTRKVVILIDLIEYPDNFMKRFFVLLDQGSFVRPQAEKVKIISEYFRIKSVETINAGMAQQCAIIAVV